MATIRNTVTITATPDDVWAVLSDMPATRQWLPGVVAARMEGDVRVCTMADGQEVHERISNVSDDERRFRFDHVLVPLPVHESGGTFTVTSTRAASINSPPACKVLSNSRWTRSARTSRRRSHGTRAEPNRSLRRVSTSHVWTGPNGASRSAHHVTSFADATAAGRW